MDWNLKKIDNFTPRKGPLLVVVMDGVGIAPPDEGNAVHLARTPMLDWLETNCPSVSLKAHGTAVGLPSDADMGNSEVGHNALGAGRVFDQGAKLVSQAISSGAIWSGNVWQDIVTRTEETGGALHLIGLLSDGNVHSHQDHLEAIIKRAAEQGIKRLFVHPLLDGRDVPETSAFTYIDRLEATLANYHGSDNRNYRIASGGGRMITTMDRYNADWRIVERGWAAHVHGDARQFPSAGEAIETYRTEIKAVIDQDLPPFVIAENNEPVGKITDGDAVVFFNFRGDRAIEISQAFEQDELTHFDRGQRPDVYFAGMMEYDGDEHVPAHYLVSPPEIENTMGEYMAKNGVAQFACSETQKFGHVTYFWNGNRTGMFDPKLEEYVEIESDRLSFDQRPWMKAAEITDATMARIQSGSFRFGRINYPNGDMVGHTGHREAVIISLEALDLSLTRLLEQIRLAGGVAIITADHGNSDEMYERNKKGEFIIDANSGLPQPRTSHSLNPVRCILYDPIGLRDGSKPLTTPPRGFYGAADPGTPPADQLLGLKTPSENAGLANVAATCLNLLGWLPPAQFAPSLLTIEKE
jgi:2,3-bisphosphoglycerate-independent phosphoglycerate mutase